MKKIILILIVIGLGYFTYMQFIAPQNSTQPFGGNGNSTKPTMTPKNTVIAFMEATLGTIPNAAIDYTSAKAMLTDELRSQWVEDSFVPRLYGIQDGPQNIEVVSETKEEGVPKVRVWGL